MTVGHLYTVAGSGPKQGLPVTAARHRGRVHFPVGSAITGRGDVLVTDDRRVPTVTG